MDKFELVSDFQMSGDQPQAVKILTDGIKSGALRSCTADVLHISPYRSFPSGVTASASKRHEYIRWSAKSGRIIIEDDFESEFSVSQKTEETLFSHSFKDNVIYMNTFSKTVSPSLRVGYMVLPKNCIEIFDKKVGFWPQASKRAIFIYNLNIFIYNLNIFIYNLNIFLPTFMSQKMAMPTFIWPFDNFGNSQIEQFSKQKWPRPLF